MPESGGSLPNLAVRTLSACVFVPAVLLLTQTGDLPLLLLVLLIVGRSSWEFHYMARRSGRRLSRYLGPALSLALCLVIYASGTENLLPALIAVALIVWVATLFQGIQDYTFNALLTLGGVIYLGLLGSAPLLIVRAADPLCRQEAGHLLALLFLCIWLTDSAAYLCGRQWGRKKLAPSISPAKTVVGFFSGLLGGLLPALLHGFLPSVPLAALLGLLLLASLGGQVGDLVESAIKRDLGVKDAPPFIPGHGGALDRFDSYLFAFPLAYLYIIIFDIF